MPEKNTNNANDPIKARFTRDSYQPNVDETYSYQPVISAAERSQVKTPPTGGSGVPPARNNGSATSTPVVKK